MLNDLMGYTRDAQTTTCRPDRVRPTWRGSPNTLTPVSVRTTLVHKMLLTEASRLVTGRRMSLTETLTGDELIEKLMRKTAAEVYDGKSAYASYVPFNASLVAEPPAGTTTVNLLQVLPWNVAQSYGDVQNLLREEPECDEVRARLRGRYCSCLGPRGQWERYLHREDVQDMWHYDLSTATRATASVAAVMKKRRRAPTQTPSGRPI